VANRVNYPYVVVYINAPKEPLAPLPISPNFEAPTWSMARACWPKNRSGIYIYIYIYVCIHILCTYTHPKSHFLPLRYLQTLRRRSDRWRAPARPKTDPSSWPNRAVRRKLRAAAGGNLFRERVLPTCEQRQLRSHTTNTRQEQTRTTHNTTPTTQRKTCHTHTHTTLFTETEENGVDTVHGVGLTLTHWPKNRSELVDKSRSASERRAAAGGTNLFRERVLTACEREQRDGVTGSRRHRQS